MKKCRSAALALLLTALALPAQAALHVCILRGAGGEAFYDARFQQWSQRLAETLASQCGVATEHIHQHPADAVAPPLTRESAQLALTALAGSVQPEDTALVVLIGHGSMQLEPKLLVSGPDITAADFKAWLDTVPAANQVVLNAASASAAFINTLSRPDRIVVTSTRGGDQPNATEFMEHLVQVLETDRGDEDRNGRLTLAELCNAAAAATQRWYEAEDYIATENALLDDNGDGLGSRLPLEAVADPEKTPDGARAAEITIKDDLLHAGADPAAVAAYREAIAAVEAWTKTKSTVDEATYWARLEELLLNAARLNQAVPSAGPSAAEVLPMPPQPPGVEAASPP